MSHTWNYENQDQWPARCQTSVTQSPIDLRVEHMAQLDTEPLVFTNWDHEYEVVVQNNGHTIIVHLPSNQPLSVSGGSLPGIYDIKQFHFHWGSEHTLNGQRQALEVHFVGFNKRFDSEEKALANAEGVAVLGVLYEFSNDDNVMIQPITQQIEELKMVKHMINITVTPANFLPNDVKKFYRYSGSLTTPGCTDAEWLIFCEVCKVSRYQVDRFRSILNSDGRILTENFRNIQPLNGRQVHKMETSPTFISSQTMP